ncbi:MAG: hypothetical protein HW386_552 [Gammaproteobacteria bacterium]|nr:hypothetical protein [Gammaproteobacteria bacterium]
MHDTATIVNIKTAPAGRGLDWLVDGFTIFWKNWLAWIGVTIFLIILYLLSNLVPVLGTIILQLIFPVLMGGLMSGCRAADQNSGFTFTHLFSGFSTNFSQLLVVGVVYLSGMVVIMAICGVMIIATIGSMESMMEMITSIQDAVTQNDLNRLFELIAPIALNILLVTLTGLALYLPLLVLVWFAPALIVLENMGAMTAMKASFTGCLKNFIPYLVYGVIGLIFTIIATIPLGLGWLVLIPMTIASIYLAYKDIYQK